MSRPARLNYFSFLDLMCCALGGALLVLVTVNADKPPVGSRKSVVVEVETLFGPEDGLPTVTAEPLPGSDVTATRTGQKLWERQVAAADGGKGLFVAAAPGTTDRAFAVLVTVPQRKKPAQGSGELTVPKVVRDAVKEARTPVTSERRRQSVDRVGVFLSAAEAVFRDPPGRDKFAAAVRPLFPGNLLNRDRLSESFRGALWATGIAQDRKYSDVCALACVASRVAEAKPDVQGVVTVTRDMFPQAECRDPAALQRVKEYLALLVADGARVKLAAGVPEYDPRPQLPRLTADVIAAYDRLVAEKATDLPLGLAENGFLWVEAAQRKMIPCLVRVGVSWDRVRLGPEVLSSGSPFARVGLAADGTTEFECRFQLEDAATGGNLLRFARWNAANTAWEPAWPATTDR